MIKIKLNMNLLNYLKGTILKLTNNKSGIKLNSFWKKRIKDSEIDDCITILEEECEEKNLLKDSYNGVPDIPKDPKKYYDKMAKEIEKEEKEERREKQIVKKQVKKSKVRTHK